MLEYGYGFADERFGVSGCGGDFFGDLVFGGIGFAFEFEIGEVDPGHASEHDAHGAIGKGEDMEDFGEGAEGVDVFGSGFINELVTLADDDDFSIFVESILESADGHVSPDEEGLDHSREVNGIAHR